MNYLNQVMVSTDGKIIGFQPANRVAVNNWAANPLAKELHGGKKLSPGINHIPILTYYFFHIGNHVV